MGSFWFFVPAPGDSCPTFTNTYSAYYDGTAENVNFGDILDEDSTDAVTFSMWLKVASTASSNPTPWGKLDSSANGYTVFFDIGRWGLIFYDNDGADYIETRTNATYKDNTWHHFLMTYDGSQAPTGFVPYVDNVAVAHADLSGGSIVDTSSAENFVLGVLNSFGVNYQFKGYMGDVAKIPWVISSGERGEIFNLGKEVNMCSSFSGWSSMKADARSFWLTWEAADFESASGIVDLTDNAYAGTATNMTNATNKAAEAP